jgi:hypothetical protein
MVRVYGQGSDASSQRMTTRQYLLSIEVIVSSQFLMLVTFFNPYLKPSFGLIYIISYLIYLKTIQQFELVSCLFSISILSRSFFSRIHLYFQFMILVFHY